MCCLVVIVVHVVRVVLGGLDILVFVGIVVHTVRAVLDVFGVMFDYY